jgi:hypothetical protein
MTVPINHLQYVLQCEGMSSTMRGETALMGVQAQVSLFLIVRPQESLMLIVRTRVSLRLIAGRITNPLFSSSGQRQALLLIVQAQVSLM